MSNHSNFQVNETNEGTELVALSTTRMDLNEYTLVVKNEAGVKSTSVHVIILGNLFTCFFHLILAQPC